MDKKIGGIPLVWIGAGLLLLAILLICTLPFMGGESPKTAKPSLRERFPDFPFGVPRNGENSANCCFLNTILQTLCHAGVYDNVCDPSKRSIYLDKDKRFFRDDNDDIPNYREKATDMRKLVWDYSQYILGLNPEIDRKKSYTDLEAIRRKINDVSGQEEARQEDASEALRTLRQILCLPDKENSFGDVFSTCSTVKCETCQNESERRETFFGAVEMSIQTQDGIKLDDLKQVINSFESTETLSIDYETITVERAIGEQRLKFDKALEEQELKKSPNYVYSEKRIKYDRWVLGKVRSKRSAI